MLSFLREVGNRAGLAGEFQGRKAERATGSREALCACRETGKERVTGEWRTRGAQNRHYFQNSLPSMASGPLYHLWREFVKYFIRAIGPNAIEARVVCLQVLTSCKRSQDTRALRNREERQRKER